MMSQLLDTTIPSNWKLGDVDFHSCLIVIKSPIFVLAFKISTLPCGGLLWVYDASHLATDEYMTSILI